MPYGELLPAPQHQRERSGEAGGAEGAALMALLSAGLSKISGTGRVAQRVTGQAITTARPTTSSLETVPPPGSCWWKRESSEFWRLSPMTQMRFSGTLIGPKESWQGTEPG